MVSPKNFLVTNLVINPAIFAVYTVFIVEKSRVSGVLYDHCLRHSRLFDAVLSWSASIG